MGHDEKVKTYRFFHKYRCTAQAWLLIDSNPEDNDIVYPQTRRTPQAGGQWVGIPGLLPGPGGLPGRFEGKDIFKHQY